MTLMDHNPVFQGYGIFEVEQMVHFVDKVTKEYW